MKIGRNDPCNCGSGKKYKHCCANQATPTNVSEDLLWRRIRRVIEGLPAEMFKFGLNHFGGEAIFEAWEDFNGGHDTELDMNSPHMQLFMPWFFYEWLPADADSSVPARARNGLSIGQVFLNKKKRQIDPLLVRYIEQCCQAPFSFYSTLLVSVGEGFELQDILTGEQVFVTEKSGSHQTQKGDLFYGKIVKIDHVALLEASQAIRVPPIEKAAILELRKRIERRVQPITASLLRDNLYELAEVYQEIFHRLTNRPPPILQNTDGDPLLGHKIIYAITSPQQAFDALKHLYLTGSSDELISEATKTASGELHSIEFPWQKLNNKKNKSWSNTVLGNIQIDANLLKIDVNSENRAAQIRSIVELALPLARYQSTVIESPQAMMARHQAGESSLSAERIAETEEFNRRPEVQAALQQAMTDHYSTWHQTKLPVLGGKTPAQAVKTRDGKEMVEALLAQMEQSGATASPPMDREILLDLRQRLGLV